MPSRIILHVDMDAFFASVEQRDNPDCAGKPVIVGADPKNGRGRGVVAACSYEARKYGIHSALPISKAYRKCPHGIFLRPRGRVYSKVSKAVMEILGHYTDLLEPISIDEAFLDVTGSRRLFGSGRNIALDIKRRIQKKESLTCSVGLATNKFIAKVASDLEKPDGLTEVPAGNERSFLKDLSVRRIWGVGPKTETRLHGMGVRTMGDVANRPKDYWVATLGKHGEHLWLLSRGLDDRPVQSHSGFKSLSHEHTFLEDTDDLKEIQKTLLSLCEKVAHRLRKHGVAGSTVTLKWRYSDFSTLSRQKGLQSPTSDPNQIFKTICRLVDGLKPFRQKVRLVGVALSHFEQEKPQTRLFDKQALKSKRLNVSLDEITNRFGKGSIRKASLLDTPDDEDRANSFLKK